MNKFGKNISERWGLCLFIMISALSLLGTELSLIRATSFAESNPVEVSGRIVEVSLPASSSDDYRRIRLRLNRHTVISLGLSPKRLPAGSSAADVKLGATMTVRGVYSRGKAARNPGGFSEANWFRSEGISGKLTSVQVSELKPASASYRPLHYLYRLRLHALGLLENSFAPQTSALSSASSEFQLSSDGIMQALLMGHTGGMTAYTTKALSEAGAYHLLCVSGMHLMFFLLPFRKLSSWASMSFKGQRRLLSALVFFPALLSGFGHGISRASLLFLSASLDSRVKRRGDKINSLALAGSVLLFFQPFAIRQNGFWMSFLAAGSLKLMSPQAKSKLINDLISSLAVFLILMPLTAKQQQGANLLAPFANIVLIPLATYLTVVGFLILFLNLFFPFLSQQISMLAKLLTHSVLEIWLKLVSVIANCRKTFLCLPQLIFAAIAILWALVLIFLFRSGYFKVALFSLLISLLIPFLPMALQDDKKHLDIVFLDVGQGDATLII
ncbi:MAG: ComEC/Rec2 family competence protein, partial [Eubacteriales bacterium]|nr:ComEC/Rec2 family competence protein [Eubacteriales bacterium]